MGPAPQEQPHPPDALLSGQSTAHDLVTAQDRFVAVWGQMAGAWGISRTMAEVSALLYITGGVLCTDDVMERLQISRGNASMSIRSLLDWGIVSRVNKRGDRKEYFRAEQDVWTVFRAIVRERLAREVDPLLASLYEIQDMTGGQSPSRSDAKSGLRSRARGVLRSEPAAGAENLRVLDQRLQSMVEFFQVVEKLGERFVSPSGKGLQLAATLLNKVPLGLTGGASRKAHATARDGRAARARKPEPRLDTDMSTDAREHDGEIS